MIIVFFFIISSSLSRLSTQRVKRIRLVVHLRTVGDGGQLLAFPGERLAQIALGVAHGIVSDGPVDKIFLLVSIISLLGLAFNAATTVFYQRDHSIYKKSQHYYPAV